MTIYKRNLINDLRVSFPPEPEPSVSIDLSSGKVNITIDKSKLRNSGRESPPLKRRKRA